MNIRVALLTNIPAPYRLSFFQELSKRCDLQVFFDSKSEPNRGWSVPEELGFPHAYLKGFALPVKRHRSGTPDDVRFVQLRLGIVPGLRRCRPDIVVSIEFGPRTLQAAAYCRWAHVPLIIWSEGTSHSEGWQRPFRQRIRRALVRRAQRFWTNGIESSELLTSYGAHPDRLDPGMIGVNTERLAREVESQLAQRALIRAENAIEGVAFLFSGQLVPRKGVQQFLDALLLLADCTDRFTVIFLGDGLLKQLIETWCHANLKFRVRCLGFMQASEVARIYAAADVFVLPTLDDNWSLVALEASVAGLPQVFSRFNGATADLLERNAVGVTVDPYDAEAFSTALRQHLVHPPKRMSAASTAPLIEYHSPERCAERALDSFVAALRCGRAPAYG